MYAIFKTGGKQLKAEVGDKLFVEKLSNVEAGNEVVFEEVLLVGENGKVKVGTPFVKGAKVTAKVVKNGKAKKVLVTTGIDTGENIQITSGLEEGMNVVTRGQTYLNDGDAVQIAFDDSTEDNIDTDNAIDSTTDTEQQYTIPQKENSAESASQKEE